LAFHLGPRIGRVDLDVLDVAAGDDIGSALAALLEALEDLVLDLHVPGVVVLAGLDDRTRRADSVPATLPFDLIEEGPVGHVIVLVDLAADDVAGLEIDELERSGTDGLEVRRRLARLVTLVGLEEMLGNDQSGRGAAERRRPEGRRRLEADLH